jgi:hypothetical protein
MRPIITFKQKKPKGIVRKLVQQWFGITLVQEWTKIQQLPGITLMQE